jgi:GNAT superfamily N-acetyltransferase
MATTETRQARHADMDAIEELWRRHDPARAWERAGRYFEEVLGPKAHRRDDVVLVAVAEGRVTGVIALSPDWCESNDIFWLGWFCVQEDEHAAATRRDLIRKIAREARRRGGRKVYAHISARVSFAGAHRLCEDLGFEVEARLKSYYVAGEDEIVYGLDLER